MKKIFSLFLVFSILLSMITFVSVDTMAAFPSPSALGGYQNVCLTYTYRPQNSNYGRQTSDDLMPYVAYYDINGNIKDFFFDSYLFLPCVTYAPSGARIHADLTNPTIASDWIDYVNDTFYPNRNVNALDTAFGKAKTALNNSTKKAGVFLTILYPSYTAKNFGSLGGRELDFSRRSDRKYAIKWIIDEQLKLFNNANYENLDLAGFYWLEEQIYSDYDKEMMQYAAEYLHSLGLKYIWIPYYQAQGYKNWQSYGFDLACMQPNLFWMQTPDYNRVSDCATECKQRGMSMQIEVSHDVVNPDYYKRYLTYLEDGMSSGAMNSVKFYYQDGKPAVYYTACHSSNPAFRSVYDLTYKYAKGTLTKSDLDYTLAKDFELPENVDWVSIGKKYTGCESYTDGNGMEYQNVDGKELTDGVFGSTTDGTEWHAYHHSIVDSEHRMSTVIDLGEIRTDLTHFIGHFHNFQVYGIGIPKDVRFYTSVDGVNFQLVSVPMITEKDTISYAMHISSFRITARYVKMSLLNENGAFVFCSEFLVGAYEGDLPAAPEDPSTPSEDPSTDPSEEPSEDPSEPSDPSEDPSDPNDDVVTNPDDPQDPDAHTHISNGKWYYNEKAHWLVCVCGQYINEKYHTSGGWETVKAPTVLEEGINQKFCVECGMVMETETLPKLDYIIGDVNMNNYIDSFDYILIKRYYYGSYEFSEIQLTIADVNKNDEVDSMDYVLTKRLYFGTYEE